MRTTTPRPNMASEIKTPVDLVAGFRGSGKTTLIRSMAETLWTGERVVFLLNERGRASLDGLGLTVVEWQGGCICCTASSMLEQAMAELLAKYRPDRLVLELAETARLTDAKSLFDGPSSELRVEHIIFALSGKDFPRRWALSQQFLERQMRESRAVLLSGAETDGGEEALTAIENAAPRCAAFRTLDDVAELYRASRVFPEIGLLRKAGAPRHPASGLTHFIAGNAKRGYSEA